MTRDVSPDFLTDVSRPSRDRLAGLRAIFGELLASRKILVETRGKASTLSELAYCVGVLAFGHFRLGLGIAALQTLAFFTLVCGNQATTYAVRARGRIWSSPHPCRWLVSSSVVDVCIAATLAGFGWLMMPLPIWVLASVLAGAVVFVFVLDLMKVSVFARLKIT